MSEAERIAQQKIARMLDWERAKRRELVVASALFYSVVASFFALPIKEFLPIWMRPVLLPLLFFAVLTPVFLLRRPWGQRESLRALRLLDDTLNLREMALTSWEILGQKQKRAAELLVLEETEKKLSWINPATLFKRRFPWQTISVLPLLVLWLLLNWLDYGSHFPHGAQPSRPLTAAEKLKEFSRELEERAKLQELAESLRTARALEELAEKKLRGEISDKKLSSDLSAVASKIDKAAPSGAAGSTAASSGTGREELMDLRAEIDSFKRSLPFSDSAQQQSKVEPELLGRLAALPRLSEEIEKRLSPDQRLDRQSLSNFLNQLDKGAGEQLDRLTLREIRDFLDQLLHGGEGQEMFGARGQGDREGAGKLARDDKKGEKGSEPGDQPGAKGEITSDLPSFPSRAATQLKGMLGEGKSSSLPLMTEARGRDSKVAQEEVVTSYRRRAEEELAGEQIPPALKETVRRYFLSLGMTKEKKEE